VSKSVLVIGAGLGGLFAAVLAAQRGAAVRLIAQGRGGLSFSHGCIDVWRDGDLRFALGRLDRAHPLRLAGWSALEQALAAFLELMVAARHPYAGTLDRRLRLPTALGSEHVTASAPVSLASGSLEPTPIHLGPSALRFLRFRRRGLRCTVDAWATVDPCRRKAISLRTLRTTRPPRAQRYRQEVAGVWRKAVGGARRLGLPAVLGRDHALEVFASLEEMLGVELFEIPTLPPSLPGLRIERALRRVATKAGVDIIEGPEVRGEVDGRSAGKRVSGAIAATAGGPRAYRAQAVILATGGPLHGGWMSFSNGEVQEAVFGLPIETTEEREQWVAPGLFDEQPYARFGVRVDPHFRPCDRRNRPYFENLFAAGGLLAGSDRALEGSRQAIDLASAYCAVEAALT
jgi:glycerol-3-phosphate dehydrogenase subunit B